MLGYPACRQLGLFDPTRPAPCSLDTCHFKLDTPLPIGFVYTAVFQPATAFRLCFAQSFPSAVFLLISVVSVPSVVQDLLSGVHGEKRIAEQKVFPSGLPSVLGKHDQTLQIPCFLYVTLYSIVL